MLKKTVLALTLALTPALAEAGNYEFFLSSQYWETVENVESRLGEGREYQYRSCTAPLCENRVTVWQTGDSCVTVRYHVDSRYGAVETGAVCPGWVKQ